MNTSNNYLAANTINSFKSSSIAKLAVDYSVATPSTSTLPDEVKSLGVKAIEWDLQKHNFIKDVSNVDLLVYRVNNSVSESWDINEQIESLLGAIKV